MISIEKASLVLKTSDLLYSVSNSTGYANAAGTIFTWNNINLRILLGDMYEKFDRFNLCLNTMTTSFAYDIGSEDDDLLCYITIAGLPWINNSYNQKTNTNTTETIIATCAFNNNQQTTNRYYDNTATFIKNQDICNITIKLLRIFDNISPTTTNEFPQIIFIFDIVGIEEYRVKNITDSRMIK